MSPDMNYKRVWDKYGQWLVRRVGFRRSGYSILMKELHNHPFHFFLRGDENRSEDGKYLRGDFIEENGEGGIMIYSECSTLEMLVAFAIRIDREYIGNPAEEHPEKIFWEMLRNLGLSRFNDNRYSSNDVNNILYTWQYREFEPDGVGSIFPLRFPKKDQRKIEIWSQMHEYLSERYPIF